MKTVKSLIKGLIFFSLITSLLFSINGCLKKVDNDSNEAELFAQRVGLIKTPEEKLLGKWIDLDKKQRNINWSIEFKKNNECEIINGENDQTLFYKTDFDSIPYKLDILFPESGGAYGIIDIVDENTIYWERKYKPEKRPVEITENPSSILIKVSPLTGEIVKKEIEINRRREVLLVKANEDAVILDIRFIAKLALEYLNNPIIMGGGNGTFTGFIIPQDLKVTSNGIYSVQASATNITITGIGSVQDMNKNVCKVVSVVTLNGDITTSVSREFNIY